MDIAKYLESTYLKEHNEHDFSEYENMEIITNLIREAIKYRFKLVMIRSKYIKLAKRMILQEDSNLLVGTVIDFPLGRSSIREKLKEANIALKMGADELDYVADYNGFKQGFFEKFDNDIILGTKLSLDHNKILKWIIETGALSNSQIKNITERITMLIMREFPSFASNVFIKTSTGYYEGTGAMVEHVKLMKSVSSRLPIKASGGISTFEECKSMVNAGATRIGTSKAINIFMKR